MSKRPDTLKTINLQPSIEEDGESAGKLGDSKDICSRRITYISVYQIQLESKEFEKGLSYFWDRTRIIILGTQIIFVNINMFQFRVCLIVMAQ